MTHSENFSIVVKRMIDEGKVPMEQFECDCEHMPGRHIHQRFEMVPGTPEYAEAILLSKGMTYGQNTP